jgi:hypothetical protein
MEHLLPAFLQWLGSRQVTAGVSFVLSEIVGSFCRTAGGLDGHWQGHP